ncbi:S8 family serine peptidase [Streptomyces sp. NPDC059524]|uniref:S8 family serine peptidase n=1 Tax=Streptomyces sp. NPDC059524 TaxID=3346856 RepID=UPI0036863474
MRPHRHAVLGAASVAALALTGVAASTAAAGPPGGNPATRHVLGDTGTAAKGGKRSTVTLVTGDRVLVVTDSAGRSSASVLPREDGTRPTIQTYQRGKDLYVHPESAAGAIADGTVDEQLFNVTGLIRQGYDDAHTKTLPLIATFRSGATVGTQAAVPEGAEHVVDLPAVDGVALAADKKDATAFWKDVSSPRTRTGAALEKLWLDGKVKGTLDRSTAQVRAPEAWAEGYDGKGTKVAVLDTGADAEHPDLSDRIASSQNFTDSSSTDDKVGHGTHTASTVGGSGAASDGKKKGVAPGTSLLIGKVLNDGGSGQQSWVIAGMQWAVDQKADVVSMSLGNPAVGDCTDPVSEAAKSLSRNTHSLFVVAAGNAGPGAETVSSPGCVPGVLTVGAVDRDDSTAQFSSRGPVAVTHTLKPEIAAPGVGISAASAGGRGVYAYRTMSGTSMATPHVAGAAAVVRQAHPDWTAQQIKAALVSSARTGDTVPGADETGSGVLDVAAAVHQKVVAAPAVQGGSFDWPQSPSDRTTVTVPFTNTTGKAVTLDLKVDGVHGNDGSAVRSGVFEIPGGNVTVPAGDTVDVPVRVDPTAHLEDHQYGAVTGRILATGDGAHVSVPVTAYIQPKTVTLRVKVVDRDGEPAAGGSSLDVVSLDTDKGERRTNGGAQDQTFQVRPGDYAISSFVSTYADDMKTVTSVSYLGRPQLHIAGDTTVVLDARTAHRLSLRTERPSKIGNTALSYARSWDDIWQVSASLLTDASVQDFFADVEGRADDGAFEFRPTFRAEGSEDGEPYVYNLSFPMSGPLRSDRELRPRDAELARVTEKWHALGKEADYLDALWVRRPGSAGLIAVSPYGKVHVPVTRTAYYTTGDERWYHGAMTSFPFAAFMGDQERTYSAGQRRTEEWYGGPLRPTAPRDADGKLMLTGERQADMIGFQTAQWNDSSDDHWTYGGSFGDLGKLELKRDGEVIGTRIDPYGAFKVPDDAADYELTQTLGKILSGDRNWLRSTAATTTWGFRSHREDDVYSRGLPMLFPAYDVPVDGMNTLPAESGVKVGLSVEGHAGYTPAEITEATLAYSYDDGATWTEAPVERHDGRWTAVLDHTGATGKQVMLKAHFADADGAKVTQTVTRAYDVR